LCLASTLSDTDTIQLAKTAEIILRDMLQHQSSFKGTFEESDLQQALPHCLLELVSIIIEHGPDIGFPTEPGATKSDLVIVQLLQFSCYKRSGKDTFNLA